MARLHNKILVVFCVSFLIQGCSVDGMVIGGGDSKKTATIGATENRRIPEQNPTNEEDEESSKVQSDISVQYLDDDNQQGYQDYKANSPPKDFSQFRKKQREAELKAARLNQSMDEEASAFKESQAMNEPMEIDGQSNLSEIIDYNKNKQAQSTSNKKTKPMQKSSEAKKVKKKAQSNAESKEESCKGDNFEAVKSSSEDKNNDTKTITIKAVESSKDYTSSPKTKPKKKETKKHSDPVTSKQQNKSTSNKKHKISVKPVVDKKKDVVPAKAPVVKAPVVTKKEDKLKNNAQKPKVLEKKLDVIKVSDPNISSVDTKKINKEAPVLPAPPVVKKDIYSKKAQTSEQDKEKATKEPSNKDNAVATKADDPIKVPEIFKDPIIDAPILTNKDEYSEVPTTYLVVDPSEVMGNTATAENPDIGDDRLVNPFVEEETPKEAKSKADIRNLSHDEFKKALKEKFKKNNEGKYVGDSEMNDMSSIEIMDNSTAQ